MPVKDKNAQAEQTDIDRVLELLREAGRSINPGEVAGHLGISSHAIGAHVRRLRLLGHPIVIERKTPDAVPSYTYYAPAPDAPLAHAPDAPQEQPANEREADPETAPTGPPLFAGFGKEPAVCEPEDCEVQAIADCVHAVGPLSEAGRARVLAYVSMRYAPEDVLR
jgi:biotin operon repressor